MKTKSTNLIAFAAMLTALNVVFIFLGRFIPGIELLILLFFPTLTALFVLDSNVKITLAYFIATILLTLLIDYNLALLYVLPSIVTGIVFGIMIRRRFSSFYIIAASTITNSLMIILTNLIIKVLYNVDLFSLIHENFASSSTDFIMTLIIIFALIQSLLSYFIILQELKRLNKSIGHHQISLLSYILPVGFFPLIFLPVPVLPAIASIATILFIIPLLPKLYYRNPQIKLIVCLQIVILVCALPLINIVPHHLFYSVYLIPFIILIIVDGYFFYTKKQKPASSN